MLQGVDLWLTKKSLHKKTCIKGLTNEGNGYNMCAYDEVYIGSVMKTQGELFFIIRDELPGIDEKWFIELYMRSHARKMLDQGNPKYLNLPVKELLDHICEEFPDGEYIKGHEWGGFLPQWVGKIYALYQWKYNVLSSDLIEILPLDEMERVFPTLHQAGWDTAVEKIHEFLEIAKAQK